MAVSQAANGPYEHNAGIDANTKNKTRQLELRVKSANSQENREAQFKPRVYGKILDLAASV